MFFVGVRDKVAGKRAWRYLFSPKQIRSTSKTGRRPGRWYPPRTAFFEQQDGIGGQEVNG